MAKDQLKPCRCGADGINVVLFRLSDTQVYVGCDVCGATGLVCGTVDLAIAAWNEKARLT